MTDWLDTHLPPLLLAVAGGLADFLTSEEHSWRMMLISLFLAGFTGYIVLLLCIEWQFSEGWQGVIVGVSGLSSRSIITILKKWSLREIMYRLRVPVDKEKDDDTK